MNLDRSDIEVALQKKGFVLTKGDHNFFTYRTLEGRKTSVWTKTSYGAGYKTLSDNLVNAMAKQCGLSNGQFQNLVACPLSQQELEYILISKNKIILSTPKPQPNKSKPPAKK